MVAVVQRIGLTRVSWRRWTCAEHCLITSEKRFRCELPVEISSLVVLELRRDRQKRTLVRKTQRRPLRKPIAHSSMALNCPEEEAYIEAQQSEQSVKVRDRPETGWALYFSGVPPLGPK